MKVELYKKEVLMLNNKVVNTSFKSKTRQLFDCDGDCFIYYNDEQKLIKIKFTKYINLMVKLNHFVETIEKYG